MGYGRVPDHTMIYDNATPVSDTDFKSTTPGNYNVTVSLTPEPCRTLRMVS